MKNGGSLFTSDRELEESITWFDDAEVVLNTWDVCLGCGLEYQLELSAKTIRHGGGQSTPLTLEIAL